MLADFLATIVAYVNTISGGNPMLTTGIIGGIAVACRKVPFQLFKAIKFRLTYTITEDNINGPGYRTLRDIVTEKRIPALSRVFSLSFTGRTRSFKEYFGIGSCICYYNGRLYWANIRDLPSEGVERQKRRITIRYYGLSKKPLIDFVNAWERPADRKVHRVLSKSKNEAVRKCPLNAVCLPGTHKDYLRSLIKTFDESKSFAKDNHLDHKLVLVLPGEPGSGKSTMARVLASEMDLNLSILSHDVVHFKDSDKDPYLDDPVFLLEDLHSNSNLLKDGEPDPTKVSLDTLLMFLQGPVPKRNLKVVLTTNDPDKLHPAILRPSRVTGVMELSRIEPDMVIEHLKGLFDDLPELTLTVAWRACDLAFFKQSYFAGDYDAQRLVDYIENEIPELPDYGILNMADFMQEGVSKV